MAKRTRAQVFAEHENRIVMQCPEIDYFAIGGPTLAMLDGIFTAHELQAIVAALEALQMPDAWEKGAEEV